MSEENAPQKERFLQEVEQKLLRKELDARLLEDGLVHVRWNEKPLCSVDRDGIVRFRPADITGPEVDRQLRTVMQTATQAKEYMRILERAPALKVVGLDDELLQFNAAVERFGLSAADELIDLSFCAREVTVVSDFNDLELVGKRHYLTVHGACDSEELENLDSKETALALISGQSGYVTRYGVVYDNGINLEQAYDRKHLPPIWMAENSILELKIRATGEDAPKKQEWVQLPTSRMKLERAMLRVGIASCGEMQILFSGSRFPDAVDCALDFEHESLFELNQLCHACSNFKEQNFVKLGVVCQMAKPTCAANICQLAENLDQFDFAPNVHTPEELGEYMIGSYMVHSFFVVICHSERVIDGKAEIIPSL